MKATLYACLAAALIGTATRGHATAPEAAPIVRFHPSTAVWAHPLENRRQIQSLVLQNTALVNPDTQPVTLMALRLDILSGGVIRESRFFDTRQLEQLARGNAQLQASGMLQAIDFQFAPAQLFGASDVALAGATTLPPGTAFYLPAQLLAWQGTADSVRVSASLLGADGRTLTTMAALPVRTGTVPGNWQFPVRGRWQVAAAATPHSHHRWGVSEEFALDLIQTGAGGLSHHGDGQRMSDYHGYGAEVRAIATGVVSRVRNDLPDNTGLLRRPGEALAAFQQRLLATQDQALADPDAIPGNVVVIHHETPAGPVWSVYAHLQPGSVKVAVGDTVTAGEVLAAVGGSGNSTEPHLHFHLCDQPDPLRCAGLPIAFADIEIPHSDWDRPLQSGDYVETH